MNLEIRLSYVGKAIANLFLFVFCLVFAILPGYFVIGILIGFVAPENQIIRVDPNPREQPLLIGFIFLFMALFVLVGIAGMAGATKNILELIKGIINPDRDIDYTEWSDGDEIWY